MPEGDWVDGKDIKSITYLHRLTASVRTMNILSDEIIIQYNEELYKDVLHLTRFPIYTEILSDISI